MRGEERGGEQRSQDQEVREEPERRTTTGNIQGFSLEQKQPQSAAEPSVTGTFKCGGKRAVKVQKRPSPSLHPPRRHWGTCLQLKKEDGGNGKSSE